MAWRGRLIWVFSGGGAGAYGGGYGDGGMQGGTWFDTQATYMPYAQYGIGPQMHGARGGADGGTAGVTLCVLRTPWAPAGEEFIRVRTAFSVCFSQLGDPATVFAHSANSPHHRKS